MKKAYTFIRSMRFGMLLLAGIGILCILATVSGNEKIYSSWYFILLFAVLGLNLSLCSFQRVFRLKDLKLALVKKGSRDWWTGSDFSKQENSAQNSSSFSSDTIKMAGAAGRSRLQYCPLASGCVK